MSESLFARAITALDQRVRWDRLPTPLGLVALVGLRQALRRHNLFHPPASGAEPAAEPPAGNRHLTTRMADGTFNDLRTPGMGSAGTPFGRNVPLERTYPEPEPALLSPNPRTVSRELLTRHQFQPATSLNVLAACWLQFEIRDWFSHGPQQADKPVRVPVDDDDPWPDRPMRIARTTPDEGGAGAPTFTNVETHWWDASQLYGSDEKFQRMIRTGRDGKLKLTEDGLLPVDPASLSELPGGVDGWWLGLALLHILFMREHNAVCDGLRAEYPSWGDEDLFDHARLIVAALIAKIHTVEWTTAILGHPTLQIGMRANWWGLATERLTKLFGRVSENEVISGIPGSKVDHHEVPYSITEEFVAVYRMHPLIPDEFSFRSLVDDRVLAEPTLQELTGSGAQQFLQQLALGDAFYSLGTAHPGAITLHNYPRFLQEFTKTDGSRIDLAAIDILRSRERGVPRYNEFRELLRLPRIESFAAMCEEPSWAEELERVYGDVDRVDLTVGMFAERPPEGFGFSDTAFRIFILMASRRLKSDRFFTTDYTPAVYTQAGLDWVADNDMGTVLRRHLPGLAPALRGVRNAFAPWNRVSSERP